MKVPNKITSALILMGAMTLTGCQNRMHITVRRIDVPSHQRLLYDSPLGAKVSNAQSLLRKAAKYAKYQADTLKVLKFDEKLKVHYSSLSPYIDLLISVHEKANKSGDELGEFWGKDVIEPGVKEEIWSALAKARTISSEGLSNLKSLYESAIKLPALATYFAGADDLTKSRDGLLDTFQSLKSAKTKPGFGGFLVTDLFEIKPSDPIYHDIFSNGARLSAQPITSASVGVSGDSSIMIVVENATQVRVYQVSNDPTQLARNVAFITSKAVSAIARFSAVAAP